MSIHNNVDHSFVDNFTSLDNFLEFLSTDNNLIKLAGTALAAILVIGTCSCLKRKKIVPIKTIDEVKQNNGKIAINLIAGHSSTLPLVINVQKFLKTVFPNSEIELMLGESVNREEVDKVVPGVNFKPYSKDKKDDQDQLDIHFPGNDTKYTSNLRQALTSWVVYGYSTSSEVLKKSRNVESMIMGIPQRGTLKTQQKVGLVFNEELFKAMGEHNSSLTAYNGSKAFIDSFMKDEFDFARVDLFFGEYSNVPAALKYILLACNKSKKPENDIVVVLQGNQIYDNWFNLKQIDQLQAGLVYHLDELNQMGIDEIRIQVPEGEADLKNSPFLEKFFINRKEDSQSGLKDKENADEKGKQKLKESDNNRQVEDAEDKAALDEDDGIEENVKKIGIRPKSGAPIEGKNKKLLIVLPGTIPYKDTVNLLQLSHPLTTVVSDVMLSDVISAGKVFSYVQPCTKTEFCKKLSEVWNKSQKNEALDDLITSDSRHDLKDYLSRNRNQYSESDLVQGFIEFSKELHENQNFMLFLYNKLQEYIELKS